MRIKKAFTLAEIMIVLTVIGFLAVFMLSALSKSTPDKNRIMYKKAYSVLERTVAEMVNDESLYAYDSERLGFLNYDSITLPGLGIQTVEAEDEEEASAAITNKFCNVFLSKMNAMPVNLDEAFDHGENSSICNFYTTDGILWSLDRASYIASFGSETWRCSEETFEGNNKIQIRIDTNGLDEGNSVHTVTDAANAPNNPAGDVFCIDVFADGRVNVSDYWEREYLRSSSVR